MATIPPSRQRLRIPKFMNPTDPFKIILPHLINIEMFRNTCFLKIILRLVFKWWHFNLPSIKLINGRSDKFYGFQGLSNKRSCGVCIFRCRFNSRIAFASISLSVTGALYCTLPLTIDIHALQRLLHYSHPFAISYPNPERQQHTKVFSEIISAETASTGDVKTKMEG